MKGRKPKILEVSTACPQKNRTESEGYAEEQTLIEITENNLTTNYQSEVGLLEYILSSPNLNKAYKQVKRNKGVGGVGKMQVESRKGYLLRHKGELITAIHKGKYHPNPMRRVDTPKETERSVNWVYPPLLTGLFNKVSRNSFSKSMNLNSRITVTVFVRSAVRIMLFKNVRTTFRKAMVMQWN